jgi:hypothetical protein
VASAFPLAHHYREVLHCSLKAWLQVNIRIPRGKFLKSFYGLFDKVMEIYAIITGARQFGYKKWKLARVKRLDGSPKPFLDCAGQGRIFSDKYRSHGLTRPSDFYKLISIMPPFGSPILTKNGERFSDSPQNHF